MSLLWSITLFQRACNNLNEIPKLYFISKESKTHNMVQSFLYGVFPSVDQIDLRPLHRDRGLAGDGGGQVQGGRHHRLLVREHVGDEATASCLIWKCFYFKILPYIVVRL